MYEWMIQTTSMKYIGVGHGLDLAFRSAKVDFATILYPVYFGQAFQPILTRQGSYQVQKAGAGRQARGCITSSFHLTVRYYEIGFTLR